MATTPARTGIRTGPRHSRKAAPCSTWSFRSSMEAQIHMAGSIWTRVSRQLDKSSRKPWKSMATAPTASARGARMRRRWLSWTTAASTMASSPSRILWTSSPAWLQKPVGPAAQTPRRPGRWPLPHPCRCRRARPVVPSPGHPPWQPGPPVPPSRRRVVSYRASELREGGTNGCPGDAAGRDGSSLLMNPVTWRHAPSKAPGRVGRPHPTRVCLCGGQGPRHSGTGAWFPRSVYPSLVQHPAPPGCRNSSRPARQRTRSGCGRATPHRASLTP